VGKKCIIESCDNILSDHARMEECHACRSVFRYWYKKRPDQVIARQHALEKWQERMIRLAGYPQGKKHGKAVKHLK
jgi:hypothetical protein